MNINIYTMELNNRTKQVEAYLTTCLDGENCNNLIDVYDCFINEKWYPYERQRYNNDKVKAFEDYLRGLPSGCTIATYPHEIQAVLDGWSVDITEQSKESFYCDGWYQFIAKEFFNITKGL